MFFAVDHDANVQFVPEEMRTLVKNSSMCYSVADLMTITKWKQVQTDDRNHRQPVHLITQWYQEVNLRRRRELIIVLHMNVVNEAVTKIHLLQPDGVPCTVEQDVQADPNFPFALLKSKLVVSSLKNFSSERLTIEKAILYANENVQSGYAVLMNLDVFFDQSLILLRNAPMVDCKTAFYLSRYEVDPTITTLGLQCSNKYVGSHDALIFHPPVSSNISVHLPFQMGTWNIEVKIIHEFIQQGYTVRNVCKSLRIWHLHSSQVRHRLMPSDKFIPGNLLYLTMRYPETL
ncbi:unnamed protein product [Sphagnum troendelagicum]|uniref:Uncharacterized protein n=1 Tax=Sphagnum troendelagicum TaxID=128251 RepID=A0ABP0T6S2_9BRYO